MKKLLPRVMEHPTQPTHELINDSITETTDALDADVVAVRFATRNLVRGDVNLPLSSLDWLNLGYLRFEKCEIKEAKDALEFALVRAKQEKDPYAVARSLSALLHYASETLNQSEMNRWEAEVDEAARQYPDQIPPILWYCKAKCAVSQGDTRLAQRHSHRFLREARKQLESQLDSRSNARREVATAWIHLLKIQILRGHRGRAKVLADLLLSEYTNTGLRGIHQSLFVFVGRLAELNGKLTEAMEWYKKAHAATLKEHNWFAHLYVLLNYARIARLQQNFQVARWYLELVNQAVPGPEFGNMRKFLVSETELLDLEAVDLFIDAEKGVIRTREGQEISLRKQYILLDILKELTWVHSKGKADTDRGLSKGQLIERVWKENYRPAAHDNKLYYNINRLRKVIEPDMHHPKYLINWKEGYRFAPGLRVHFVGEKITKKQENTP